MKLIIVQGATSTGKSTLASRLAKELRLDVYLKDSYKEKIFNDAPKTPGFFQWYGIEHKSWWKLYEQVLRAQETGTTLLIEGNFGFPQRWKLRNLVHGDDDVREIFCYSDGDVHYRRFRQRYMTGERHAGHLDHLWYPIVWLEAKSSYLGWHWMKPLGLSDKVLRLNTTDFTKIDYRKVKRFITE